MLKSFMTTVKNNIKPSKNLKTLHCKLLKTLKHFSFGQKVGNTSRVPFLVLGQSMVTVSPVLTCLLLVMSIMKKRKLNTFLP